MRVNPDLPNRLRTAFGTLAFLCLLVAGVALGATWVVRTGLERDAVAEAGKAAGSVIRPELRREDLRKPMAGERYEELRTLVDGRVVNPPVTSVEIWNEDSTIVYAGRRSRLGEVVPAMREWIHSALASGSLKLVDGETFRALVPIRLPGDAAAVVEVDRSYPALLAEANAGWRAWVDRGIAGAVASLAAYVLAVAFSLVERRRRARAVDALPEPVRSPNAAPPPVEDAHVSVRRRTPGGEAVPANAPAYMQPGFREHLEARREAEDALVTAQRALAASEQERHRLQERLRQAEAELEQARRRLAELGATAGR